MNLLVVGNGFDLAHNLPTQYDDFLYFMGIIITKLQLYPNIRNICQQNDSNILKKFVKIDPNALPSSVKIDPNALQNALQKFVNKNSNKLDSLVNIEACLNHLRIKNKGTGKIELIESLINDDVKLKEISETDELVNELTNNTWLYYFFFSYKHLLSRGINWIDLENEIASLLNFIDKEANNKQQFISWVKNGCWLTNYPTLSRSSITHMLCEEHANKGNYLYLIRNNDFANKFNLDLSNFDASKSNCICSDENSFNTFTKNVFSYLYSELKDFDKLLVYYLNLIDNIKVDQKFDFFRRNYEIDTVLSFNYTNTYSRIYDTNPYIDFINGDLNNDNIILGIENPHLDKLNHYCDNGMYIFFKYFQRVSHDLTLDYHKWLIHPEKFYVNDSSFQELIMKKNHNQRKQNYLNVLIIGHSLDISDKQILSEIILSAKKVVIFYYNEDDKKQKKVNLLKILGEEQFIKSVNNETASPQILFSDLCCIENDSFSSATMHVR